MTPPAAPPFPRLLLSLCLAAACHEAYAGSDAVPLKATSTLSKTAPNGQQIDGPTHVEAEVLHGEGDNYFEAEGKVVMRNLREQVEADWIHYNQAEDEVHARGHVALIRDGDRIDGSELKLKLTDRLGDMKDVIYALHGKNGSVTQGKAKDVLFQGPDVYQLDKATYSTCPANAQAWVLKVDQLNLDYNTSLGSGRKVQVEYMNIPILYSPWLDFSLDDMRKSGFLSPTYGVTTNRGLELVTPWYWNIAPNMDATITPRLMSKRGTQLGGEFRYLESSYHGSASLEVLPNDQVTGTTRYYGMLNHQQTFDAHWSGSMHVEKVSDSTYFTDLSSLVSQTSRVNLLQDGSVAYNGDWWQAAGHVQRYQTLQDPSNPVTPPYERLPQLTLNAKRSNVANSGLDMDFSGEFVDFIQNSGSLVQGSRIYAHPSVSLPIDTPYSTFTPRLGWYLSRYALDKNSIYRPDSQGATPTGGFADSSLNIPTFSVNTGLFFERGMDFAGKSYTQTLEPRAFYVYIPYRDQSRTPVFDSGTSDLSLDQIFQENQFVGVDRINDANQLTLTVTSRFLDHDSGAENLQVTLGQRYYFSGQLVTMPGVTARSGSNSDLLGQVSSRISNKLWLSSGIQFDTASSQITKADFATTWRDGPGRLFNADYRYTQDSVNQIDFSSEWPLAPRWHGLVRLNYSIRDARLVEGLAGFEYDAGCWSLRSVIQRLATTGTTTSNAFFLQLELNGLTKFGPNPLDVLKRSITGYVPSSQLAQPDPSLPH